MNTNRGHVSRFPVILLLAGLLGAVLGWWLHGPVPTRGHTASPTFDDVPVLRPLFAPAPVENSPKPPRSSETYVAHLMERVFETDTDDMMVFMEETGALARMTDVEVRLAWAQLMSQPPVKTYGGSLTAMYLWSRMWRMGEKVAVPESWGTERFEAAMDSETARHNREEILERLKSGGLVSDVERRVIFADMIRKDPVNAMKLWCQVTEHDSHLNDPKMIGNALLNPETRDAVMAQLRAWQKNGDAAGVISYLTQHWVSRDPAEVERWAQQPEQADIREGVMFQLVNARSIADPADAWQWSRSLPEERRLQALGLSASQLANGNPAEVEMAKKMIADLQIPAERQEAIRGFASTLAANDFNQWQQWRNTLPKADQDAANESSFHYLADNDIHESAQWLNTLPEGETRDAMMSILLNRHAHEDPQTAAQWINTIADSERQKEVTREALSIIGAERVDKLWNLLNALQK